MTDLQPTAFVRGPCMQVGAKICHQQHECLSCRWVLAWAQALQLEQLASAIRGSFWGERLSERQQACWRILQRTKRELCCPQPWLKS